MFFVEIAGNILSSASQGAGWAIGAFKDIHHCDIHDNIVLNSDGYGIAVDDGTSGDTSPHSCTNIIIHDNI